MDLKDVIKSVREKAVEAHNAFHAGHNDVAENYLRGIRAEIIEYEKDKATPAGDVTESTTSEKHAETQTEKPAAVPGAVLPATQFVPAADAQQVDNLPESQKQTR